MLAISVSCAPNNGANTGVNVTTGQAGTGIIKGKVTTEGFKTAGFSLKASPDLALGTIKASSSIDTKEVKLSTDGSFSIEVKGGADYKLEAIVPDGLGGTLKVVNPIVTVPLAKDPAIVDVKSLVTKQTGSIQGLIVLEDPNSTESLEGADVYIAGTSIVGKVRDKGRFALTEVAEGTWDIVISKSGFERATVKGVQVKAGKARLVDNVVLKRSSSESKAGIKGSIQDSNGSAIVGASITAYAKGKADSYTAISDDKGEYNLVNLPSGDYQVQIYRAFYELPARKDVSVKDKTEEMGATKLKSTVVFFGKVKGKVVDEDGKVIDGAVVQTLPQVTDQQFADAGGNFTLDRVLPGEYSASISAGGYCTVEMSLRVENTENYLLTLDKAIVLPKKDGDEGCSQVVSAGNLPIPAPKPQQGSIESSLRAIDTSNLGVLKIPHKVFIPPLDKIDLSLLKPEIVFSMTDYSTGKDISDIYLLNPNRGYTNLTNNNADDVLPVWSKNGEKIAWVSADFSGGSQAWVMNSDGTNKSLIPIIERNMLQVLYTLSWSPDDSKFVVWLNTQIVYTMNNNGSHLASITPLHYAYPDWSSTNKIVYTEEGGSLNGAGIAIMNPDGTNKIKLINQYGINPNWSPDGSKLVFTRYIGYDLYVMNADGTNLQQLTNTPNEQETNPQWSPDGKKIIFQSKPNTGRTSDYAGINIMNEDGTGRFVLLRNTNTKVYRTPDWRKAP